MDCNTDSGKQWYVMRDLTRPNAKRPAYLMLKELNIKYFTPMVWKISVRGGKRIRQQIPFMHDLLFVYESRSELDALVRVTDTFQYRFQRGSFALPMTVSEEEMNRFIFAVESAGMSGSAPVYYSPDEITPEMRNRKIRIVGGRLDGYEGSLVTTRGSKKKRLLIELTAFICASVEVEADYIRLL